MSSYPEKIVLYTSYDGITDNLGQSQILPYVIGLSEKGYRFTILSCEKRDAFQRNGDYVKSLLDKHHINWIYKSYTKKPPVLSAVYDLLLMLRLAKKHLSHKKVALVHSRSIISAVIGYPLSRKFNARFIFDMRGFWADERKEAGVWKLNNPIYKMVYNYFKRKELFYVTHSDYVITLTEKAKVTVTNWMKSEGCEKPIQVIPCSADIKHFSPEQVNQKLLEELREKFDIKENQFVLSYLGSIGTWYMLDEMLDFFKVLLSKIPDAKFLFITGEPEDYVTSKASVKGISPGSIIVTSASRKEVPTYLSLSNWSIFFIKPVFSKSASSPTKQGEIMSMGIPHICNQGVGDVDYIMEKSNAGLVVKEFSESEYLRVVNLFEDFHEKLSPEHIRQVAKNWYSLETAISKYQNVYRSLIG